MKKNTLTEILETILTLVLYCIFGAGTLVIICLIVKYQVISLNSLLAGNNQDQSYFLNTFGGIAGLMGWLGLGDVLFEKLEEEKSDRRRKPQKRHKDTSYGYGVTYADLHEKEEGAEPVGFRYPIGKIPTPGMESSGFSDYYGHEYRKYGDTWFDDQGNACPSYLEGYYGISTYEDKYGDDD